jgi:hypothetical protein
MAYRPEMRGADMKRRSVLRGVRVGALGLLAASAMTMQAFAADLENGPVASARKLLGEAAKGASYRIDDTVVSDGLLRSYSISTSYGQFFVHGDAFLAHRLRELAALAVLERESKSDAFGNAMAKALGAPVRTVGGLVTDPVGTVGRTLSGVGQMFGRIAASAAHPGSDPGGAADALLGVSAARRQIAADLGVDPYTDFEPLAHHLEKMAKASALGGLTIKMAFTAIPGGAGTAVSAVSTSQNLQALVRDKTPAQLIDINTRKLKKLGVPAKTINAFLGNKHFTPADHTAIVSSLETLKGVRNVQAFVSRAAQTEGRDLAMFLRTRADMIAAYQRHNGSIASFVVVRGFPLNQLKDGRMALIAPIDSLAWTPEVSGTAAAITGDLGKLGAKSGSILAISGSATPSAIDGFKGLGWDIKTRIGL